MRPIDADRMKEELLWGNVFLSAKEVNALVDLIDNQPTLTPPNEPLTLEELREMGGQPYWHVGLREESPPPHWNILDPFYAKHIEDYKYGENWLAYRHPQEGEEDK